jgi:dolichol-phosphate mannosyltransferase
MAIVRNEGVRLLQCMERGKAVAVVMALKELNTDYVVMTDVDLSYPLDVVPEMLKLDNDVSIGDRTDYEWGSIPMQNEFGNRFITILANNLFENYQPDICTGLWVMRKAFYKNVNIISKRFELEANFYTEACRLKKEIGVYPITYKKRTGKSKLRMQDGFAIVWFLIKTRFGL